MRVRKNDTGQPPCPSCTCTTIGLGFYVIESLLILIWFRTPQEFEMRKHTASKSSQISRVLMIVLTVVLIFLFFDIMC